MKRAGGILGATLIAGCACGDWYIRQNQAMAGSPPLCEVPEDPDAEHRTVGTLDVALRDDYVLFPLVENETGSDIRIEGAIVRAWCDAADGEPDFAEFFSPAPAFVASGDRVGTPVIVLHAGIADALAAGACCGGASCDEQLVMVGVKMIGEDEEETAEFLYPIFACSGCLVACTVAADDEALPGPDCCYDAEPSFVPCAAGQDDAVDCRLCRGLGICQCGNPCG